jgi:hypothetical protein
MHRKWFISLFKIMEGSRLLNHHLFILMAWLNHNNNTCNLMDIPLNNSIRIIITSTRTNTTNSSSNSLGRCKHRHFLCLLHPWMFKVLILMRISLYQTSFPNKLTQSLHKLLHLIFSRPRMHKNLSLREIWQWNQAVCQFRALNHRI